MKSIPWLFATVLASLAMVAPAKEHYHEKQFNADTRDKFESVAASVRAEMKKGGRYEYVTPKERDTIDAKLTEMQKLFADNDSVQAMKQDTKIALFNAQEVVNSILTHRDRDRVICEHHTPVGSHIPVTDCHTYGQEEDARHATRNQLDDWQRLGCVNAGCTGSPSKTPTETASGRQ